MRIFLLPLLLVNFAFAQTTESLRGVSAVTDNVIWASGAGATYLRTTDGGTNWAVAKVPGAEALDFRGIHALSATTAWLMSAGPGDKSRIYRTTDAGAHWTLQFTNPDPAGFFDAIAFRDARHGMVAGDPVNGEMTIFTTDDSGLHWSRRHTPPALPNEGGFAASNSCLSVRGQQAWFGTGGTGAARVFNSANGGRTWTVAFTPIRHDSASAGIFSINFSDSKHGIAVGGDYAKDTESRASIAITSDGGRTWAASPGPGPKGFRSAIVHVPHSNTWIATGTSGSDVSTDNGQTWRTFDTRSFNALSVAPGGTVWAVGAKGQIARLIGSLISHSPL